MEHKIPSSKENKYPQQPKMKKKGRNKPTKSVTRISPFTCVLISIYSKSNLFNYIETGIQVEQRRAYNICTNK